MEKSLGEKIALLAKSQGKTQADIAERIGMAPSQLNRFLKGNSDCTTENLLTILNILDIDLEEIIFQRTRKQTDTEEVENDSDVVKFLYKNLDEVGQQTQLKHLEWINNFAGKKKIPKEVKNIINQKRTLL